MRTNRSRISDLAPRACLSVWRAILAEVTESDWNNYHSDSASNIRVPSQRKENKVHSDIYPVISGQGKTNFQLSHKVKISISSRTR